MSQYKELADAIDNVCENGDQRDEIAAILRSLDAQPVAWGVFANVEGDWHLQFPVHSTEKYAREDLQYYKKGSLLDISPLYAAPVAAQPPFEKNSWQHAVDDQLVGFGRTSQEFGSPHDAVRWLIEQEVQAAQPTALEELRKQKDGAYFERNQVVAALAKCFPSGVAKTAIEGWSEDWHGCVYIDLPTGQVSWHFHRLQAYLFKDLPPYAGKWDGHDTPEKYRRVNALEAQPQQAKPEPLSDAEILAIVKAAPALDTAEDEWLHVVRAAIAAFCQKNGIKEQG